MMLCDWGDFLLSEIPAPFRGRKSLTTMWYTASKEMGAKYQQFFEQDRTLISVR
jgi:hypothetical protein